MTGYKEGMLRVRGGEYHYLLPKLLRRAKRVEKHPINFIILEFASSHQSPPLIK